jgi:hypothetical protein
MDPALMEARLRAFYAEHNAGNQQNMCDVCSSLSPLSISAPPGVGAHRLAPQS